MAVRGLHFIVTVAVPTQAVVVMVVVQGVGVAAAGG